VIERGSTGRTGRVPLEIEYLLEELEKNPPRPLVVPDPPADAWRGRGEGR